MKEIVRLLKKENKSGGKTLYLEYKLNGKRHQESLGMFLYPETSPLNKKRNKSTLEAAQIIQSRKIVEIQDGMAGVRKKRKTPFVEYYNSYKDEIAKKRYRFSMESALNWWIKANGDGVMIEDITKDHLSCFISTMLTKVNPSSAHLYYGKITTVLNKAVREEIIPSNPDDKLDKSKRPKLKVKEREFLTSEELKRLIATPCKDDVLKNAFLFSCFTGLRYSDICSLTWSNIGEYRIRKRMIKTDDVVDIPLSNNARRFLPPRGKASDILYHLKQPGQNTLILKGWLRDAGIEKEITFHCARHTFACLLLTYDTDIYTTSKLLGHRNIATTQIYSHLVDKKKKDAIDSIPEL